MLTGTGTVTSVHHRIPSRWGGTNLSSDDVQGLSREQLAQMPAQTSARAGGGWAPIDALSAPQVAASSELHPNGRRDWKLEYRLGDKIAHPDAALGHAEAKAVFRVHSYTYDPVTGARGVDGGDICVEVSSWHRYLDVPEAWYRHRRGRDDVFVRCPAGSVFQFSLTLGVLCRRQNVVVDLRNALGAVAALAVTFWAVRACVRQQHAPNVNESAVPPAMCC